MIGQQIPDFYEVSDFLLLKKICEQNWINIFAENYLFSVIFIHALQNIITYFAC